jgi:hypothetical protein
MGLHSVRIQFNQVSNMADIPVTDMADKLPTYAKKCQENPSLMLVDDSRTIKMRSRISCQDFLKLTRQQQQPRLRGSVLQSGLVADNVPVKFMDNGMTTYSTSTPTTFSYKEEGRQEWEHDKLDIFSEEYQGQGGGDPTPVCCCHTFGRDLNFSPDHTPHVLACHTWASTANLHQHDWFHRNKISGESGFPCRPSFNYLKHKQYLSVCRFVTSTSKRHNIWKSTSGEEFKFCLRNTVLTSVPTPSLFNHKTMS